jgi:hypothetical protein
MKDEKRYFKRPTLGNYVKTALPILFILLIFYFSFFPVIDFLWWYFFGHGNFALFPTRMELAFYCIFVTFFVTREYKRFQCLYFRMQEVPFLTISKKGISMDRSMIKFPKANEQTGKIELDWSAIKRMEIGQKTIQIYFQENGKEMSEKIGLRWVEEKEKLLVVLKDECQKNEITWVGKMI